MAVFVMGGGLCLMTAAPAASETTNNEADVVLVTENSHVLLTFSCRMTSSRVVLEPIETGLKSRVVFTLQLAEKREGVFSFLGDVPLFEKTVEYVGYKDFYDNVYVLEDEKGRQRTFAEREAFFEAFNTLVRYPLDDFILLRKNKPVTLRVQAKLYPVKLIAPLTLIYFISTSEVIASEWTSVGLP